ncbi:uncharacterized protein LOC110054302 [Orbicella faveolata]|uniref:uncharacterized protein LOC110054302 n=1 Tax=Orbicella faveolata TaxID=48498 RepID=UPI0009E4C030|nr:uncharacterized protein LOC110054302 [Orbicella faveolata]
MSELISTAPLYTKDRVHLTKIGNILCTGKGCIGCDRKYQTGEQDFSEILGDVDSVDFSKQEPRFTSNLDGFPLNRQEKSNRRHGNTTQATWGKNKKGKFCRRATKLPAKEQNVVRGNTVKGTKGTDVLSLKKKINRADSTVIHSDNDQAKRYCHGVSMKTAPQTKLKIQRKNKSVSFAAPLVKQETFTIEENTGKSAEKSLLDLKPKQITAAQQLRCFHGRLKTYPPFEEKKTNFLQMLHNSSVGIFDIESMQNKKSSKWVQEVLKSGSKEEELFPQIHSKITGGSDFKRTAKIASEQRSTRKGSHKKESAKEKKLPKASPRESFAPVDDSSSVLVFEHEHEETKAKDESLHKLGFKAQRSERTKSFPDVSILEIADCLEEFVQLGVIKLISQEHANRWCVLVRSRIIRDYLIQSGVTLRGKRFELLDYTAAK